MKYVYRHCLGGPTIEADWLKMRNWIKEKGIGYSQDGMHLGNYCLVNIPEETIEEVGAAFPNGVTDKKWPIFELSDLKQFHFNDKVTIKYKQGELLDMANERGTVLRVEENELVILKLRSRKYGWRIRVGEKAEVVKGWKKAA